MANTDAPLSANVGRNVRALRVARGWSVRRLSEECATVGATQITHSSIANLERDQAGTAGRKPREVTVDELYAFARVLGVSADRLVHGPRCEACDDMPPAGFACLACGAKREKP